MSAQATWSQPTLTPNPHICIHLRAFVSTRRTRPGNWSSKTLISKSHKDLKTNQPHYFPASSASSPLSRLCHTSTGVTWARTCGGAWAREKWTRAREHIIFWSSWPGTDLALGLCDYVARSQEDGQCTLLRSPKDIRYSQSAVKLCQIIQRIKNRTEKAFGGILLSGTGKKTQSMLFIFKTTGLSQIVQEKLQSNDGVFLAQQRCGCSGKLFFSTWLWL